ncbi:hypothetical protein SAMN02745704_01885 [Paucidesulfovibrio gracilis DSM 16080]|uniref:Uncharacterized protein n=2 Tax=Paucidesulfovibrio TaxID=2910985 RepID=A0A1T4X8W5_9BACT|nr:hypothetical protein SAMN02745704_01885 [Paucidesulfovibrio gracilis DSM 16080]
MSMQGLLCAPPCHAHFPAGEYAFLRLFDAHGTYALAAVAERTVCAELHLEVVRPGPRAMRGMVADLELFRQRMAKKGIMRIVGLRQISDLNAASDAQAQDRWFRFTRAFGFTEQSLVQTAFLDTDARPKRHISGPENRDQVSQCRHTRE